MSIHKRQEKTIIVIGYCQRQRKSKQRMEKTRTTLSVTEVVGCVRAAGHNTTVCCYKNNNTQCVKMADCIVAATTTTTPYALAFWQQLCVFSTHSNTARVVLLLCGDFALRLKNSMYVDKRQLCAALMARKTTTYTQAQ